MSSRRYQDTLAIAVAMALLLTALLLPPLLQCHLRRHTTLEWREAIPTIVWCEIPAFQPMLDNVETWPIFLSWFL